MKKSEKIKSLQLQVNCLTALLAEYIVREAIRKVPIPHYTKGGLEFVSNGNEKETILSKEEFKEQQKQAKEQ